MAPELESDRFSSDAFAVSCPRLGREDAFADPRAGGAPGLVATGTWGAGRLRSAEGPTVGVGSARDASRARRAKCGVSRGRVAVPTLAGARGARNKATGAVARRLSGLATGRIVAHAAALVAPPWLRCLALADAGAAFGVLTATGLTDIETAERIEFRLFRLFLLVTLLGVGR